MSHDNQIEILACAGDGFDIVLAVAGQDVDVFYFLLVAEFLKQVDDVLFFGDNALSAYI